jgi:hypothetical protein
MFAQVTFCITVYKITKLECEFSIGYALQSGIWFGRVYVSRLTFFNVTPEWPNPILVWLYASCWDKFVIFWAIGGRINEITPLQFVVMMTYEKHIRTASFESLSVKIGKLVSAVRVYLRKEKWKLIRKPGGLLFHHIGERNTVLQSPWFLVRHVTSMI